MWAATPCPPPCAWIRPSPTACLNTAGIEQAHYLWFYADRFDVAPDTIKNKIQARLDFPVFVKPANAGSSVGVSKVERFEDLDEAIRVAAREDAKIVVEEGIRGQEVECAVLGNREAQASIVGEIGASAQFYDYDDKYINGTSQLYIPARIAEEVSDKIRATAVRAYRLLGCSGLARVDFFVTEDDHKVVLNEINTLPGFTSISMYPKLWMAMGLTLWGAFGPAHRPGLPEGRQVRGGALWITVPSACSTPA